MTTRLRTCGSPQAMGFGEGSGLVSFELEEEIAAVFDDYLHVFSFAVEGVACDYGVGEIDFLVEALGRSGLAFGFGGFAFGFFGGDGDGEGAPLSCSLSARVRRRSRMYFPSNANARGRVP